MATEEYSVGYEAGYQDGYEAAVNKRVPLTDEQIVAVRKSQVGRYGSVDPAKPYSDSIAFARAIERAHGIGGGK